jgi:hypothetical protein
MWIIPENKFTEDSAKKVYKYITGDGNNKRILSVPKTIHDQIQEAFKRRVESDEYRDPRKMLS